MIPPKERKATVKQPRIFFKIPYLGDTIEYRIKKAISQSGFNIIPTQKQDIKITTGI